MQATSMLTVSLLAIIENGVTSTWEKVSLGQATEVLLIQLAIYTSTLYIET